MFYWRAQLSLEGPTRQVQYGTSTSRKFKIACCDMCVTAAHMEDHTVLSSTARMLAPQLPFYSYKQHARYIVSSLMGA